MAIFQRSNVGVSSLLAVFACLGILLDQAGSAGAGELRLGVAAVKITPPDGTPMAGYFHMRGSEGVLDDIHAKAAVLDDGQTKAAMVTCDLIGLPRSIALEARRLIAEKTGIAAENVMISATHTHTGPVVVGGSSIEDLVTGGSKLSKDYAEQLPRSIAQAVEEAQKQLTAVRVSYGSHDEPSISFIRRFWMNDGTVGWNPGRLNPKIIRPIGAIDPQVTVVLAETLQKKPVLTYVNFAMHLDTTGGQKVSADYPATLARRLADYQGPDMLTIFATGTCGNVNHVHVKSARQPGGPQEAMRLGTILSAAVLKTYLELKPVEDTTLRTRREVVETPPIKYTEEELRKAQEILARHFAKTPFLEAAHAYPILDLAARNGKPLDVDVQVFSLGQDIAWVALPGECFVELGLSIKAASPFRQTHIIELANGGSYYIPNRSAYAEGNYEVVSTPYAEGTGELLVTTAIRLLKSLHQDAAGPTTGKPTTK